MSEPGQGTPTTAYADLVADVASALSDAIPGWRIRIGMAAESWRARGIQTAVLERALALSRPPDVDALLETFARAVTQLAALEEEALGIDGSLAGSPVFRDPGRIREAAALLANARSQPEREPPMDLDPEHWVLVWPDVTDLLVRPTS